MYSDELEKCQLSLDKLFLDPNNPRFWSERERKTSENRIPDTKVQKKTQERIEHFGVKELCDSILRNGFLPMDRIVVRPIQNHDDKYVAVEGNRRLAALKSLHDQIKDSKINEDGINDEYLEKLKISTNEVEVLIYKGNESDISWVLQGIRHISGVRDWSPEQRAILVAKQVDDLKSCEHQGVFTRVGQQFGMTAKAVARFYRVHKALEQLYSDDEYGSKSKDENLTLFTLFHEAYKNAAVRNWLEWDEDCKKYKNNSNLKRFYNLIIPDEEKQNKRRIHNPDHIKFLAKLVENNRNELLGAIERDEMNIEEAKNNINTKADRVSSNWVLEINAATDKVQKVPLQVITEQPEDLKKALVELRDCVDKALRILENEN